MQPVRQQEDLLAHLVVEVQVDQVVAHQVRPVHQVHLAHLLVAKVKAKTMLRLKVLISNMKVLKLIATPGVTT